MSGLMARETVCGMLSVALGITSGVHRPRSQEASRCSRLSRSPGRPWLGCGCTNAAGSYSPASASARRTTSSLTQKRARVRSESSNGASAGSRPARFAAMRTPMVPVKWSPIRAAAKRPSLSSMTRTAPVISDLRGQGDRRRFAGM